MKLAIEGASSPTRFRAASVGPALGRSRHVRAFAIKLLQVTSVIVGAGLLIRTGGAEPVAATKADDLQQRSVDRLQKTTMPVPAFGIDHGAVAMRGRSALGASPIRSDALTTGHRAPLLLPAGAPAADRSGKMPTTRLMPTVEVAAVAGASHVVSGQGPEIRIAPDRAMDGASLGATGLRAPAPITASRSNLADVMRRPASAWDYAGVVLPEASAPSPSVAGLARPIAAVVAQPAARAPVQLELALTPPKPDAAAPAAPKPVAAQLAPSRTAPGEPGSPQVAVAAVQSSKPSPGTAGTAPNPPANVEVSAEPAATAMNGSPYLPENNVAARPVSRSALAQLAAMAARVKPINAAASSAYAAADAKVSKSQVLRDRMPTPEF